MDEHERRRALSFGADAGAYDRTRPSYPGELVDWLLERTPGRRVVDVGCGTAKLGRLFVERGCEVVGVEPDERMAAVARTHGLDVEVSPFESWDEGGRRFDLVVSGQAWHWVDPVVGGARAAEVVRPGGRFAAVWNLGRHDDDIRAALDEVYERFPEISRPAMFQGTAERRPLVGLDAFGPQEVVVFEWTSTHTTADWLDQLPTHSDHRLLPADRRAELLGEVGAAVDAAGGSLTIHYETVCWTAVRPES